MKKGAILDAIFALLLFAVVMYVWWQLCISLPYQMAQDRNRDGVAWVLISLIGSPFLAIFLLWLLGKK